MAKYGDRDGLVGPGDTASTAPAPTMKLADSTIGTTWRAQGAHPHRLAGTRWPDLAVWDDWVSPRLANGMPRWPSMRLWLPDHQRWGQPSRPAPGGAPPPPPPQIDRPEEDFNALVRHTRTSNLTHQPADVLVLLGKAPMPGFCIQDLSLQV
jgi:hypothetical protein